MESKNVLYLQYPWRLWRLRLAGVYRYAAKAGWHIQTIDRDQVTIPVRKLLDFWRPDGCLVEGLFLGVPGFRAADFGSVPVVWMDADPRRMKRPYLGVEHDSAQTASLAAKELLSLGLANYGFVGYLRQRMWSDARLAVMEKAVAAAGAALRVFSPPGSDSIEAFARRLRSWLAGIPKPCGVFAANDTMADIVLQACAASGLKVPDDVAVIGVDDDELICEHTRPTLTSVAPDFERSGHLAAELLDGAFSGDAAPRIVRFGATHVVRRNSTVKFSRRDDAVRRAWEMIRRRSCDGLTSAEVCREMGGSRRRAEMRFREGTGKSIGEAIREVRVSRAKELLLRRDAPLESMFAECGYRDAASLRKAFRRATGMSMREYAASRD